MSVHGGSEKAAYIYPVEHYLYRREQMPDMQIPPGMSGEDLTTDGLSEEAVYVGDRYRIGSFIPMDTKPRMPWYKLETRFGRSGIIKRFLASGRSGFYLSVLQEAEVGAGDARGWIGREKQQVTIAEFVRSQISDRDDMKTRRRPGAFDLGFTTPSSPKSFIRL